MAREIRFKDRMFDLSNGENQCASWINVQIAALYDIRDELQALNRLLHCQNFQAIPRKLDRISANTAKPRKKRSRRKRHET